MKLKLMMSAMVTAGMLATAPVWADHLDRRDRGYHNHHGHYKHGHHWRGHRGYRDRVVVREYVRTVPVYQPVYQPLYQSNPAPAPGIHIVTPDLYFPFPR